MTVILFSHFIELSQVQLLYSSAVKRLAISLSVLKMLLVGACKVVRAAEILLCAHIQIVVMYVI